MKCPNCKHDNRHHYEKGGEQNFCENCGEPLDKRSSDWIDKQVKKDMKEEGSR